MKFQRKTVDRMIIAASYPGTSLHIYQDIWRHTYHTVALSFFYGPLIRGCCGSSVGINDALIEVS